MKVSGFFDSLFSSVENFGLSVVAKHGSKLKFLPEINVHKIKTGVKEKPKIRINNTLL